jgi:hypothetical protein
LRILKRCRNGEIALIDPDSFVALAIAEEHEPAMRGLFGRPKY